MIEGYSQRGELVYRFRYIVQLADYLGLDYNSIRLDFDNSRQFNFDDYMFHIPDKQEELSFEQFEALICQYGEDNSINFNDISYGTDGRGNICSMLIEDKVYTFKHVIPMMFAGTHTIIEALNGKLTAKTNPDPEFVEDFGYPQPKEEERCDFDELQSVIDVARENGAGIGVTNELTGETQTFKDPEEVIDYFKARNQEIERRRMAERDAVEESRVDTCYDKEKNHMDAEDGGKYDTKGNSSHYQANFMEFIREQERKYGTIVALLVAQSNVDKYNQRAGMKEGVPAEKDLTKRDWYFKAVQHFKKKVEAFKSLDLEELNKRNSYVGLSEEVLDLLRIDFSVIIERPKYVPLSEAIELE